MMEIEGKSLRKQQIDIDNTIDKIYKIMRELDKYGSFLKNNERGNEYSLGC